MEQVKPLIGSVLLMKIDNLLKRRPNRWGNLSNKEFERDIKLLQDTCLLLNEAVAEDDETKERLLRIVNEKDEEIRELKEKLKTL